MDAVERKCPVCDGSEAGPWLQKGDLRLVRCQRCAMIFANPVTLEMATGSFYDERGDSFYLSPQKLESDYSPVRFVRELRLFRRYCRTGSVLDVGCSSGAFLFNLQARYPGEYRVTGTDVTRSALDYAASHGIPVIRSPFLQLNPKAEGSPFDAVTFWAVIEHLVQPKAFLQQAHSLLTRGGLCFILVPNLQSLAVRVLGSKYRYIMPDHVNYFTRATLKALARSTPGFETVTATSTHFNPIVIAKDLKGGVNRVSDADRAALLSRTTRWKQNRLLRPVKWIYAGVESVLGKLYLADNLVVVLRKG